MAVASPGLLACENCFIFHVAEDQTATEVALVAMAALSAAGALVLLIRGAYRRGAARAGAYLAAAGLLLVPLGMIPVTQRQVLYDLPWVTAPSGVRVRADHADCDKAIYASWNLEREMPTEKGRVALEACRSAADGARRQAMALEVVAVGLIGAGLLIARTGWASTVGLRPPDDRGHPVGRPDLRDR